MDLIRTNANFLILPSGTMFNMDKIIYALISTVDGKG